MNQRKQASRGRATGQSSRARRYRKPVLLSLGRSSLRVRWFAALVAVLLAVAGGRAVQLQGLDANAFAAEAAAKMQYTRELAATRGDIVDRNGAVLATTTPAVMVYIDPDMIRTNGADKRYPMSERKQEEAAAAPEAVADLLVKHLGGRKETYLDIIDTPDSHYEIVARQVPAHTFTKLKEDLGRGMDGDGKRPWYGVFSTNDPIRVYPNRTVAANVVGFVNGEGVGAAGLEYALNRELTGTPGTEVYDRSTYGRIPLGTSVMTPAVDGAKYRLTLDADLQWMTEQALAEAVNSSGAATGTAVVMNAKTGELLALANNPTFDPSNPGASDVSNLGNRAVTSLYEPGSVQKVLTMAALADQGLVTPDTKVVVPSRIASGGGHVSDAWSHGTLRLTARGVLAQSSNVGTIELARQMDKGTLTKYLGEFGLGRVQGTGLPGEAAGSVPGGDMADYTRDQVSFGQGLSVNAIQMAAGVSAAVNGGTYHQPSIIASGARNDGTAIDVPRPQSRKVISPEASAMVRDMMEAVITIKDGRAIPGYRTIGKSGTAQRYDSSCKCYNGYTSSFVGAAPAEDPQIVVYVVLDRPKKGQHVGSQVALPVVNNVLSLALPRFNVAPSTTPAPDLPLTFD